VEVKYGELLNAYQNGDGKAMWDNMKGYVFGNNKFYAGLTSRRVAEYLLFTASTKEEIETAYCNTYERINENHREKLYTEEDLKEIKRRIKPEDTEGLYAINQILARQR